MSIFDNLILINMLFLDPPTRFKLYSEYNMPPVAESFLPVGSASLVSRDWVIETKYCPIVPVEVSGCYDKLYFLFYRFWWPFFCMFCRLRRIHLGGVQRFFCKGSKSMSGKSLLKKRLWRKWSKLWSPIISRNLNYESQFNKLWARNT